MRLKIMMTFIRIFASLLLLIHLDVSLAEDYSSELYIRELKRSFALSESSTLVSVSRPEKGEHAYDIRARPNPIVIETPASAGGASEETSLPLFFVFDLSEFEAAARIILDYTNFVDGTKTNRQGCEGCGVIDEMCAAAASVLPVENCQAWLRDELLHEMLQRSATRVCGGTTTTDRALHMDDGSATRGLCHTRMESALRTQLDSMKLIRDAARQHAESVAAARVAAGGGASDDDDDDNGVAVHIYHKIPLPSFADFERAHYAGVCDELSALARSSASVEEALEGNIWCDGSEEEREALMAALASVDAAATSLGALSWTYLEIGFNAGHSSAMVLSTFPNALIHSFDICQHKYTLPNYDFLLERFKARADDGQRPRLSLSCGDSREILVGNNAGDLVKVKADAVRVDGGHTLEVAASDILNAQRLAKPGALLLLDDCTFPEVWEAWQVAVDLGVVVPEHAGLGWRGMCIGRFTNNPAATIAR